MPVAEGTARAEAWGRLRDGCLESRFVVDEGGELEVLLYRLRKWLDRLERGTSLTLVQIEVLTEVIETAIEVGRESSKEALVSAYPPSRPVVSRKGLEVESLG